MSSKVSATAIGGFVVGALALVTGGAVFFGGSLFGTNNEVRAASVIFTGSVKGLNVGAPVTLRGVKIGEVSDIGISYDSRKLEFVIPVIVTVNPHELGIETLSSESEFLEPLVARGLRAQPSMPEAMPAARWPPFRIFSKACFTVASSPPDRRPILA